MNWTAPIYQTQGPVIVAGDFNAHLPNFCLTPNTQGNLVYNLIDRNHLYPVPLTNPSNASNYTFFSGSNKYTSIIDYIFLDAAMAPHLISSKILDHHPLNLSDHLPISISLKIPNMGSRQCHPSSKSINWSKAISSGSIKVYEEKVKLHIAPLLQTPLLSVDDIDCEIRSVATFLIAAAGENLPLFNLIKVVR